MGIPSGWELVILLVVLVVLFGATKLPTAARSIGQSIRIFKAETKGPRSEQEPSAPAPQQVNPPQRDNDALS
ncbi:Sec-independent protein translocase subunit TatA [Mycobacterium sp.]|jgi:sec-independent protein translocase protein TatA|uniref:Sec-independent protein translocase subunit TatA n=1 Tax=Mycobacterium sp. TaxID=1785 RepID=UPI00262B3DCE|nr:Sec-independent protein translocase subunit TatA [Mycobacterium sp.]